jgi:hypothetical protein
MIAVRVIAFTFMGDRQKQGVPHNAEELSQVPLSERKT